MVCQDYQDIAIGTPNVLEMVVGMPTPPMCTPIAFIFMLAHFRAPVSKALSWKGICICRSADGRCPCALCRDPDSGMHGLGASTQRLVKGLS